MYPTLRVPDLLYVEPAGSSSLGKGDIVLFHGIAGTHTVHRIIAATPQGWITTGDANLKPDPDPLRPEALIGKVVQIGRRGRRRTVPGGYAGMVQHYRAQWRKRMLTRIMALPLAAPLRQLYRRLSERGIFHRLLPRCLHPKVYRFRKPWGEELHLMLGRTIIGTALSGSSGWRIRAPYRLFVDERSLPKPDLSDSHAIKAD